LRYYSAAMLSYELTPNLSGPVILGSAETLRSFHEILHDVNERSPIICDKEGVFLGLAYDVRKAFEGQRRILKPARDVTHSGPRLGFEILWPTVLVQSRMLRVALGFMDSGKRHQAFAYALEAVVEEALQVDFPAEYLDIHERWLRLLPDHPVLEERTESRIEHWYQWTKPQRRRGIIPLLESLDPMFEFDYQMAVKHGEMVFMSPEQWDAIEESGDATRDKGH
jgi:hypothetical protein